MEWQKEYSGKLVPAREAVQAVKSGDRVVCAMGNEPLSLMSALEKRKGELSDVRVSVLPGQDMDWYHDEGEGPFSLEVVYIVPLVQDMVDRRQADCLIPFPFYQYPWDMGEADVLLIVVYPPDDHGYCSFGGSLWNKKAQVQGAGTVLAEVNPNLIRTYGDNFIHASELDWFVERVPTGRPPGGTDLRGREMEGLGEIDKAIAENVGALIRDGDTLQIGVGSASEAVAKAGIFDARHDLGWHSENTPRGIIRLVREGVINGRRKGLHTGKMVATAIVGDTREEMAFVDRNPLFELYAADHVLDARVIAAHDNMVAINGAIAVDLTGQIAAESIGARLVSAVGGQLTFVIGAHLSPGGRAITVLPSTARGASVSRLVPRLESGAIVSIPRSLADVVVTEHGVAQLRGKSQRQRALELVSIAHPDFRSQLKKDAERLFWP
ncbi:MAG: acetyl-CoA hydrolase/transferase C-terminal domain-containing protein [Dehalococcoidia bacterium]